MAPPTNAELARREAAVRQTLARLDPLNQTPQILRDIIIEMGARYPAVGGALNQGAIDLDNANQTGPGQAGNQGVTTRGRGGGTGRGRGGGRGNGPGGRGRGGSQGQSSGSGTGSGTGAATGAGSA
ncbi:hypothetical protein F5Y01DRAFT_318497 [Xylaria sp. FL0043]|nr:hypothetical protein F5Y01DRAFT_318497 [Xylaria sp. FL0043]